MGKTILGICLLVAAQLFYSCASVQKTDAADISSGMTTESAYKVIPEEETTENKLQSLKGYKEVSAISAGYPGIITDVKAEGDEITFLVRGRKFYFSDGKLLPEEKKDACGEFRGYGFYLYPEKLPPINELSPERIEMINSFVSARKNIPRDNSFLEELYNGHSFDTILGEIRYINFLKFRFEVHRSLIPRFRAVERELKKEAENDPDLRLFIDSLTEAGSFNWRRANGSVSRSYHSYGIAVDFNPQSFGRKQVFWDWSRKFYSEWYKIPYSRRWMVHEKFVSAFERQGFVWGGKWLFFDNMHFEYRPEILILSGFDVAGLGD